MTVEINESVVRHLLATVDAGLVKDIGNPKPGQMCVEAAVCYALGLPHSDEPPCVGGAVRHFKISLNDCDWSSDIARARGMRRLAVAQLGSEVIDQDKFSELVIFAAANQIVSELLEAINLDKEAKFYAEVSDMQILKTSLAGLIEKLEAMADNVDLNIFSVENFASNLYSGCAYALMDSKYVSDARLKLLAASNVTSAVNTIYTSPGKEDKYLLIAAEIGLEALKELKSPGCSWLYLCD